MQSPFLLFTSILHLLAVPTFTVHVQLPLTTVRSSTLKNRAALISEKERWRRNLSTGSKVSGGQSLTDWDDIYYLATIQIGTPGQSFQFLVDTGFPLSFVFDEKCMAAGCANKPKYHQELSSTYQHSNVSYPFDPREGGYGVDKMCLGNLCYTTQLFDQYFVADPGWQTIPASGYLSLGLPNPNLPGVVSLVGNLLPTLDQPLYTMYYARVGYQDNVAAGGQLTIGALDSQNCAAQVNYVPLNSEVDWIFTLSGIQLGSYQRMAVWRARTVSGSLTIRGPQTIISNLANMLGATYHGQYQLYFISCSAAATAPDFVMTIGEIRYSVPAKFYIEPLPKDISDQCYLAFAGHDEHETAWWLGEPFLRAYCHVYHVGGKKIGFTAIKH